MVTLETMGARDASTDGEGDAVARGCIDGAAAFWLARPRDRGDSLSRPGSGGRSAGRAWIQGRGRAAPHGGVGAGALRDGDGRARGAATAQVDDRSRPQL